MVALVYIRPASFFTFGTARNHNRPPLRDIQPQATHPIVTKHIAAPRTIISSPYKHAATSVAAWRKERSANVPFVWAIIDVVAICPSAEIYYVSSSHPGMVDPAVRPWPSQAGILNPRTRPSGNDFTPCPPWGDAKWASSDSTRSALRAHDMFLNHQSTTLKLG